MSSDIVQFVVATILLVGLVMLVARVWRNSDSLATAIPFTDDVLCARASIAAEPLLPRGRTRQAADLSPGAPEP